MTRTPKTAENLSKWLRRLRLKTGLSQEDAAASLRTSRRNIVRWESETEKDRAEPGGLMLLQMLALYGVRIDPPPKGYKPADVASVIEAIADQISQLETQIIAAIVRERADPPPGDGEAAQSPGAVEQ